ncbi:MAG: SNF2-related protein, partial [Planctomycetota bacterium]|nr:SNF2-related protein [Planctomycetota bacterium]
MDEVTQPDGHLEAAGERALFLHEHRAYCALRKAFYLRRFDELQSWMDFYKASQQGKSPGQTWWRLLAQPFSPPWLQTLPPKIARQTLTALLLEAESQWLEAEEIYGYALKRSDEAEDEERRDALARHALLRGHWEGLRQALSGQEVSEKMYDAWLLCLRGQHQAAVEKFEAAFLSWRHQRHKRRGYPSATATIFYFLSLLAGSNDWEKQCRELCQFADEAAPFLGPAKMALEYIAKILVFGGDALGINLPPSSDANVYLPQKQDLAPNREAKISPLDQMPPLAALLSALASFWDSDQWPKRAAAAAALAGRSREAGFAWLESEFAELAGRSDLPDAACWQERAQTIRQRLQTAPLCDALPRQARWERALAALAAFQPLPAPGEKRSRVIWEIAIQRETKEGYIEHLTLQPVLQTANKKGGWSRGKKIREFELTKHLNAQTLAPQDREVYTRLAGRYGLVAYHHDDPSVLLALIGHPHVYWAEGGARLEIVRGEVVVRVADLGRQIRLSLDPPVRPQEEKRAIAIRETPTRIRVYEISSDHLRLCHLLGDDGLIVPAKAKEKVLTAVAHLSAAIPVHSDIGGGQAAEEVPPILKPHVHLTPQTEGLRVEIFAYPFGPLGPAYHPGRGSHVVFAEIQGRRLQTRRNLAREEELAHQVSKDCPALAPWEEEDGSWLIKDPLEALEALAQLQALAEAVTLMWPQGGRRRIRAIITPAQLRISFQRAEEWFAVSGEVRLDEKTVLKMSELLAGLERAQGRFVPIAEGEFLALSEEVRRYLEDMRSAAEAEGDAIRLAPAAALALAETAEGICLEGDQAWQTLRARWQEAAALQPRLPRDFQGELRDYQKEGFDWLMRLAHAGAGAGLADDMGLGKTVQALAVLLARASAGPALVVAPLSVCANWVQEAARFAPSLRLQEMREGDRQAMLSNLGPFDVVVCTYGLLAQEEEALAAVKWHTIVLDEAQAIKNAETRRCRAAHRLRADFRLALTGTPVENHLGEIWSIFHFLLPGLLGSQAQFQQRFAGAMAEESDKEARQRLRRLVRPFVLRRTKGQVLEDLPPRTEITRLVTLSEAEMAFYEALRRSAVAKVENAHLPLKQRQMHILAEIMRLRRACCHPRLVQPDVDIPSAKLEAFGEILEDLRANRHRALVFSQFVDPLALVRAELDKRGVSYQ